MTEGTPNSTTSRTSRDTAPATGPQISYLRDLALTRAIYGPEVNRAETIARVETEIAAGLTNAKASELLDKANRARGHNPEDIPASDREIRRIREFACELALFGLAVTVEETIARVEAAINADGFSRAQARELLQLGYRAAPHPTAQTPLRLSDIEDIDGLSVSEGHYAVFDHEDVLRFYRIYTPASGANKGVGVIRRFAGDNLLALYPAEAKIVLETIDADPDAAAYRFSDTFTRCWVCGKNLTDSVSRLISVGPTCRGFANHTGLRRAASEVDHDPVRRNVFRALREWALEQGFTDPRSKEERQSQTMTASRVASAWSGIPGILGLPADEAVQTVKDALTGGTISEVVREGLLAAPKDTLLVLVDSAILTGSIMEVLVEHPNAAVKKAANDFFLAQLGF